MHADVKVLEPLDKSTLTAGYYWGRYVENTHYNFCNALLEVVGEQPFLDVNVYVLCNCIQGPAFAKDVSLSRCTFIERIEGPTEGSVPK